MSTGVEKLLDPGYVFEGNVIPKGFSDRSNAPCRKREGPMMISKDFVQSNWKNPVALSGAKQQGNAFISPGPLLSAP